MHVSYCKSQHPIHTSFVHLAEHRIHPQPSFPGLLPWGLADSGSWVLGSSFYQTALWDCTEKFPPLVFELEKCFSEFKHRHLHDVIPSWVAGT